MVFVDFFETKIFSHNKNLGSLSKRLHFDKPCLGYILKGRCEILHKGKTYFAETGDLMYIAKGTNYCSYWTGSPEILFYSFPFSFTNSYALEEFKFQVVKNFPKEFFDRVFEIDEKDYFLKTEAFYRLLGEVYPKLSKNKQGHTYDSIQPAISYIEKHCTDRIYVESLAALCNLSPSRFFDVFKKAAGNTPIGYKNAMRIQKGMDLLNETDMTIEEISDALNFSSPAHFRTQFRKIFGITPKRIRD